MDPASESYEGSLIDFFDDLVADDSIIKYISNKKNISNTAYKFIDGTIPCKNIGEIISAGNFYACQYSKTCGYFMVLLHITDISDDSYLIEHTNPLTGVSVCITATNDDLEFLIGCKTFYRYAVN